MRDEFTFYLIRNTIKLVKETKIEKEASEICSISNSEVGVGNSIGIILD